MQVIQPDRGRCRACTRTHVLLPAFCLPRRGYRVEVVGAALLAAADGAGHTRAAAACGAAVRDWIRAVTRSATTLIAHAARLAPVHRRRHRALAARIGTGHATDRRPDRAGRCGPRAGRLPHRARADPRRPHHGHQLSGPDPAGPPPGRRPPPTAAADPDAARHATPWQMVAVLTAGQLLIPGSGLSTGRSAASARTLAPAPPHPSPAPAGLSRPHRAAIPRFVPGTLTRLTTPRQTDHLGVTVTTNPPQACRKCPILHPHRE